MGGEKLWKILCKPVGIFFEFSFCFVRLMLMKQLRDLKPLVKVCYFSAFVTRGK